MSALAPPRSRRGALVAAAAAAALAVSGGAAIAAGLPDGPSGPPQPVSAAEPPPVATPTPTPPARPAATGTAPPPAQDLQVASLPRVRPVSLSIPSIGVRTGSLIQLGKEPDGTLEVPRDYSQAGWFEPGPAPGQLGPSVIAGHVDSKRGPAVFYRLGELRPGAAVSVGRADGSTARFVVDRVERYPKDRFPTVAVYGDSTHRAELRLITCGGAFDRRTGHYVDNVVAYAHLV